MKFWTKATDGNYPMNQRPVCQDNTQKACYLLIIEPVPLAKRGSRNTLHRHIKKAGINGEANFTWTMVPELGIISKYWEDELAYFKILKCTSKDKLFQPSL